MTATHLIREIRRRMEALNLNPRSLSLKAGLNATAIRDIVEGTVPKISTLQKIAKALGCTVADLTGERPHTPVRSGNSITIFEVHTGAQGGPGGSGEIELTRDRAVGEYTFPSAGFRQRFGAVPDGVFIDEMTGDSQMPTIMPGQPLMIDSRIRKPSPPGIFLCWDGIGMVYKRIEVIPNTDPVRVRLLSDNPRYSTYERTIDEVEIFGRVVGGWQRF